MTNIIFMTISYSWFVLAIAVMILFIWTLFVDYKEKDDTKKRSEPDRELE